MIPRVLAALLLGLVYVLMLGSLDPRDLLIGLIAGGVLVWWQSGHGPAASLSFGEFARRTAAFVPFALAVAWNIVVGTWQMILVVLRVRPHDQGGIIDVPMGERTRSGVVVQALVETLSPGSVVIELDWAGRTMVIHVMDATDPVAQIDARQIFYDRFQHAVFP